MQAIKWNGHTLELLDQLQLPGQIEWIVCEVAVIAGKRVVPEGVPALHPAFDVTPHELITAIITEKGVIQSPNTERMAILRKKG